MAVSCGKPCKRATVQLKNILTGGGTIMHIFGGLKIQTTLIILWWRKSQMWGHRWFFKGLLIRILLWERVPCYFWKLSADIVSTIFQSELMTQRFFWHTNPLCELRACWIGDGDSILMPSLQNQDRIFQKLVCFGCVTFFCSLGPSNSQFFSQAIQVTADYLAKLQASKASNSWLLR